MTRRVGIDVGGTFTDFVHVDGDRPPLIAKALSTPADPSIAVMNGLADLAARLDPPMSPEAYVASIDTIVHGTTVTTNATLTRRGATTALITTKGLRDALEMRRGIREKQYDNRTTNVAPLAPRHLRFGIAGRIDRDGREVEPLSLADVDAAIDLILGSGAASEPPLPVHGERVRVRGGATGDSEAPASRGVSDTERRAAPHPDPLPARGGEREQVAAVAICFMNSFANPAHEAAAAARVRARIPDAYLSVSSELLPSIRFYDRLSTTALNAYVGPVLDRYLDQLRTRLKGAGFRGTLLVMQSNGGVIGPDRARARAATTLLSGPAGGPRAGLASVAAIGRDGCIVVDMGGTSFEAALVAGEPIVVNGGTIDRLRIALPMLDIHTIGAGGGSIAWLDGGGLLRVGPRSAGADPGPASYGRGGVEPTTTDANIALGYLDPDYFAGGAMTLDADAARRAIEARIAPTLGMSVEQAAAGMFRVACNNMAQGIREVTIRRGHDPREFPLVVAGGAGGVHGCEIARELEIPLVVFPRLASILCASGMLMSDFSHDFVRTFVARLDSVDFAALDALIELLAAEGDALLASEGIAARDRSQILKLDCRYLKQYQEVTLPAPREAIRAGDRAAIAAAFHAEHNRLFGYALEAEGAPVEIVNVRVTAVGRVEKLTLPHQAYAGPDAAPALKGERRAYAPERGAFVAMPVYDWARLRHGNRLAGPAIVESETTTVVVTDSFDALVDAAGSVVAYANGREDLMRLRKTMPDRVETASDRARA